MERRLPRVLIAAPKSGSGKTLFTCGLLNLMKRKSNKVISYKCGPDYIDPMFHRKVLGINGGNLDSFFQNKEDIINELGNCEGEMAVIEGVMGLYDGMSLTSIEASSYEIASYTNTPIILIIDGKGAGRTVISLIKGILADDKDKLIKGIIINNISKMYYEKLAPVIESELAEEVRIIGYIPNLKDVSIDSRHLGLKLPEEIRDINRQIDLVSDAIVDGCSVEAIYDILESASDIKYDNVIGSNSNNSGDSNINTEQLRLAVARDEAFCFYYKENLELLENKGITLVEFSPLRDIRLPDNIQGILLGGGYPENHLDKLSNNKSMLMDIRERINNGIPCLAECGGFMYLHDRIVSIEGKAYDMAGVVNGECSYKNRLVRFGYIELTKNTSVRKKSFEDLTDDSSDEYAEFRNADGYIIRGLSDELTGMKGHEFHYYDSTSNGNDLVAVKPSGDKSWETMICNENQVLGFPHLYYLSKPEFIDEFINRMKDWSNSARL